MREAIEAIEQVRKDPHRNQIEARRIAEDYFESGEVLSRLLTEAP